MSAPLGQVWSCFDPEMEREVEVMEKEGKGRGFQDSYVQCYCLLVVVIIQQVAH